MVIQMVPNLAAPFRCEPIAVTRKDDTPVGVHVEIPGGEPVRCRLALARSGVRVDDDPRASLDHSLSYMLQDICNPAVTQPRAPTHLLGVEVREHAPCLFGYVLFSGASWGHPGGTTKS